MMTRKVHIFKYAIIKIIFFPGMLYRTLYCAKGNYEFGISRVIKSLEPYQKKLGDRYLVLREEMFSVIDREHGEAHDHVT